MEKEYRKIVVMGGSFNPPTMAHYRLMKEAVDALKADIGFFVPVSDAYLKRKMRHSHPPVVLTPEMRVRMLQTMCSDDSRLRVCEKEIGTVEARTMPTLLSLKEDYPAAELYFLMGDDKLKLLAQMTERRNFLDTFKAVLYSREGDALDHTLKNDEVLAAYLDRIVVLPQPSGTEGVSSSLVRKRMLAGECSSDLLCPGVWELFKEFTSADFTDVINRFRGEYDFLNNRFHWRLKWQGLEYGSVEAAFQASKSRAESERRTFVGCSSEKAALKGKDIVPYPGWEEERLDIMESIIRAKFEQNPMLMKKLKATEKCILINGNNKQETFWGVDLYSWIGENHLGKILMRIRDEE